MVHGGEKYSGSVVITNDVTASIPPAPAAQPRQPNRRTRRPKHLPGLTNAGVFDTAFHQTMPEHAYTMPRELYRKYGFHSTGFRYVAPAAAEILGKKVEECTLAIAHLGNGASVCAVKNGESQDTGWALPRSKAW